MKLVSILKSHGSDALIRILFVLVGTLAPTWLGAFIIIGLYGVSISFMSLLSGGEFALYTASMMTSALYILTRDKGSGNTPRLKPVFMLCILILILLATSTYSTIVSRDAMASQLESDSGDHLILSIDGDFVSWVTLIIFLASVLVMFAVDVRHEMRTATDVLSIRADQLADLSDELDQLEEGER